MTKTVSRHRKTTKAEEPELNPLLVCTANKGVFFGYGQKTTDTIIELQNARMCVYWSTDVKGVLGLASIGPTKSCKIGRKVPSILLQGVTAIAEVTPEAVEAWEKAPWT